MSNKLHSLIAESSVCGAVMLDNTALDRITLSQDDFYFDDTRAVFSAIVELHTQSIPCDVITVSEYLEKKKAVDFKTVSDMAINCPTPKNIVAYADIVLECAKRRKIIELAENIKSHAQHVDSDSAQIATESMASLESLTQCRTDNSPVFFNSALQKALDAIQRALENDGVIGLSTGFTDLDKCLLGLKKNELIVVAGRPAMGKSAFAMNIVAHAAKSGSCCAVFSMEMSEERLIMRMLATESQINLSSIISGQIAEDDWASITLAMQRQHNMPVYFDTTPALSVNKLRARCKEIKKLHGKLDLIVIDYLQLMSGNSRENRNQEVSEISRGLKLIANEFDAPVLALSQLNRSLESRGNKRPMQSDLRDSGAIEQDADVILGIYRDEIYNENSTDKGTAEIIVLKNRDGETKTIRLLYRGEYVRFDNFTPRDGDFDQWDDE